MNNPYQNVKEGENEPGMIKLRRKKPKKKFRRKPITSRKMISSKGRILSSS